ncbi:acyl-CoA dehydrogenase [Streptomyces sp. TRM43335]|uniref:Acyl-CoA dehydrogenase n=2 Tax=Streptomyces taklimakanensis TaxID=2569853 RepID=A0A6G2BA07_9ACTN|nr:acyl-CoA dehydrogenase family protein [Streptomyces taklimakanensis]MTE19115.1 acyl-CoA dehydrogenase [Streptomyces taklimakanensis]
MAGHPPRGSQTPDVAATVRSVVERTVSREAPEVDRQGRFPRASVEALAEAGLLGLLAAPEVGGAGQGLRAAAHVVERLAASCGSTAMVTLMHYAATTLIEAHGPTEVRRAIAAGTHLTTLALSEAGSRSHFWAPLGTARPDDRDGTGGVLLDADKSWVTSAGEADSYVWSSRPLDADGPMTLWLVPADTDGLSVAGGFDGLGLRGNSSSPVTARQARLPRAAMLGDDGAGMDIALATALPAFLVLNAAASLGTMEAVLTAAREHLTGTRLAHLGRTLADDPSRRGRYAELRVRADGVRAFVTDTLTALETDREDATLRVLQVKAVAAEAAAEVTDGVMKLCGGSAFRRDLGVERHFRDSLAARVMAPTTEALHDFTGRASLGLPLFDAPDGSDGRA